jgi:hypothetical protein
MRTTIEIADALFRQAKLKAVEEGVTLKMLVERALEKELGARGKDGRKERVEQLFAQLDKATNGQSVGKLRRDDLYDRAVLRRH